MAVIIGGGSSVSSALLLDGHGVVSVSFGQQPSVERLWELGSFSPYDTWATHQRNFTLNVYGKKPNGSGGTAVQSLAPSTSCSDSSSISITFNPSACSSGAVGFVDTFFITGYSYSKDTNSAGQESWQFISKPSVPTYSGSIYMLRGMSTGQVQVGDDIVSETDSGVVIDASSSLDSYGQWIEGVSGQVSSGFPGIGNMETTREVVFSSVGGSLCRGTSVDGKRASVSCSVQTQAIYL